VRIGLDIGTTLVKAVLFGAAGEVLARLSVPTRLFRPGPGQYEMDFEQLLQSVLELLKRAATPDVELIALTGQGDGLWLLDATGRPVRPPLTWLDARGAEVCDQWATSGVWKQVVDSTHNAPFAGAGAALLRALDRDEPSSVDAAATATQCQLAVFERLTGVPTATPSCAMLPVFDPVAGDYDESAIRLTQLGHRRDLLPPISSSPVALAPLRDEIARQLQLRKGVLVATGPYDLPAAARGIGPLVPGDGVLILGTTLGCMVLKEHVESMDEPVGLTLRTADGNGFLRAMPAMVGTACIDWVLGLIGSPVDDLGRLLAESEPGARGVSALPFLAPAGEHAPFADLAARAELTGLTLEATPADLVRAVCESLGYAARHCFEAAGLTGQVTVCGGGAGSLEFVQLLADVLERPLTLSDTDEPAALGAVIAAVGALPRIRSRRVIHPRRGQYCADAYNDYRYRLDVARQYRWRADRGRVH
jgi:erythritol kinase (D-erythritol 1-phosphate-forming)